MCIRLPSVRSRIQPKKASNLPDWEIIIASKNFCQKPNPGKLHHRLYPSWCRSESKLLLRLEQRKRWRYYSSISRRKQRNLWRKAGERDENENGVRSNSAKARGEPDETGRRIWYVLHSRQLLNDVEEFDKYLRRFCYSNFTCIDRKKKKHEIDEYKETDNGIKEALR